MLPFFLSGSLFSFYYYCYYYYRRIAWQGCLTVDGAIHTGPGICRVCEEFFFWALFGLVADKISGEELILKLISLLFPGLKR